VPEASNVIELVRDAVSMATNTNRRPRTIDSFTATPDPGDPAMYEHRVPLQMSSLTSRDTASSSVVRVALYWLKQEVLIAGAFWSETARLMLCVSTRGPADDGWSATAEPEKEHHRDQPKTTSK